MSQVLRFVPAKEVPISKPIQGGLLGSAARVAQLRSKLKLSEEEEDEGARSSKLLQVAAKLPAGG